ncbi:MAG: hypothetical protein HQM09_00495 [Candidatus Riflebacteria bacterium]|nr:hypothetical protein [Candidatus Riflebacteria bacterium]
MSLQINTNIAALTAHKNLVINDAQHDASIERLSSGLRINRAADDAAGLTISEKLRTQVKGINRAIMNVQDGISLIQTAEGALNEVHSMLQRMRELAVQSSNDTLTSTDRLEIQKEVVQLKEDINRISYGTEFNTKKLLDGSGTAVVSTSDPKNLDGVVTGEVQTFSDFSVTVLPTTQNGVVMKGTVQVQRSNIFMRTDGQVASGTTTLQSISNFYDQNGTFILDIPQTLYVQGDNKQAPLVVSKDLTVTQLAARIQSAMTTDQLGQGLQFDGSTANFSNVGDTNGQLEVTSGKYGNVGRVNLAGDQALITAFGFQQVIAPQDPVYDVSSTNLGTPAGERTTVATQIAGHRAAGLIQGIDLMFQPPTAAFVNTLSATLAISIPAGGYTFNVDDSLSASGTANIVIASGSFTMSQIASIVNNTLTAVASMNVRARINDAYALEFYTLDTGSAAYVSISGAAAGNSLGVANGRYTGSGGNAGLTTSTNAPIANFDFTTQTAKFTITDYHGNAAVAITLNSNFSAGGMTSLVDAINAQITGTNVQIRAENDNGVLAFRSLETGFDSNFTIADAGGGYLLSRLNINDQFTNSGFDGNAADQNFAYEQAATHFGYEVLGNPATDNLSFAVMDADGKSFQVQVAAASAGVGLAGAGFITIQSLASLINGGASNTGVKVNAEISSSTETIRIYSTIPGKTGRVTLTELGAPASPNTLSSVLNVVSKTYDNGSGDYTYKIHLKDAAIQFQDGPNQGQVAKSNIIRTDIKALGIEDINLTNVADSQTAIGLIDQAIQRVSSERAKLGAIENRMTYTTNSLRVGLENMTASESRIRDIDMASEVTQMTKYQVLAQASQSMVAQANTASQRVLDLLR